ncbi:MAG: metal-dependent transcriptional regulator [Omnitrophica bacterium]|nr:metal-dependent transcriptional regulator [Candidatus Omnitrophota bacterium]
MPLTEGAEEILETLWIELKERKKPSCNPGILKDKDNLSKLVDLGYVNIVERAATLTHSGSEEARSCVRRHRLAERLFVDILYVKKGMVHDTSCKFEHLLHKGLDDNICTLLGHPKTCPHGRPIPEGKCCRDIKALPGKIIMPLSELAVNKKAKISYLHTENRSALQKIIVMGALPNIEISLVQRFPTYVFQIGKSQFAIDRELASCIFVRLI